MQSRIGGLLFETPKRVESFFIRDMAGGLVKIASQVVQRIAELLIVVHGTSPLLFGCPQHKNQGTGGKAGKVTPVMDRAYPLSDTRQAIDHVAGGHARGKVAITVSQEAPVALPAVA